MQEIEKKEQEMIQKLKTTFNEMQRTEQEVQSLEKGSTRSVKTMNKVEINRKLNALLNS